MDASERIVVRNFENDAPALGSSPVLPSKSVNTYWLFDDNTGDYITADVTFNWDPSQVDAGSNTSAFIVGQYYSDASEWSIVSSNTPQSTSIVATGIADFTDMSYAVGEPEPPGALGDYRTISDGPWIDPGIWQRSNGVIWVPAVSPPTSLDNVITVRSPNIVDINGSISLDQTVIESGAVVKFNSGTLTIENGPGVDLSVAGPMEWWAGYSGSMDVQSGAEISGSSYFDFMGATLTNNGTFNVAQLGMYGFSGGQTINGTGTINSLLMFNTDGVTLGGDQTITDLLNFNYGPIITGPNKLIIGSNASIQNNANPQMYVQGNLQRNFPAGGFGLIYPLGDASGYRPMQLSVSGNAGVGGFIVSTTNTEHPDIASSNIDPALSVNRYWTITNNGSTFTTAFATFNWDTPELDGAANTSNFIVGKYDAGTWTYPNVISTSSTSIFISGLTSFSDFAVGEALPPPTLEVSGTYGPFCSDDAVIIPFAASGNYVTGNIFTAYLSDEFGSFASQTYLGELESNASGIIYGTIPSGISGTGYRIRIVSSNPVVVSADNGSDITIDQPMDYYLDNDEDGFGDDLTLVNTCPPPPGYVTIGGDCDDSDFNVNPEATELCNEIDDDCNGTPDDGLVFLDYYTDFDGDGYGDFLATPTNACAPVFDAVTNNLDCNDADLAINPLATEVCNNIDDDCDGNIDNGLTFVTYYQDSDEDGFGNGIVTQSSCNGAPSGYVLDNTDCDDSFILYQDLDNDSYGSLIISACGAQNNMDCNDNDNAINPSVAEVCNGIDDNCNILADETLSFQDYYPDFDEDGYGDALAVPVNSCNPVPGAVLDNLDCDDLNDAINPAAAEVCNTIDDDCDGNVDNGLTFVTYYEDLDEDGFGN
ncbi:MAG TPA: putative metal-binding motif-containing protein, partial [Chitinophagaceae bacterium]|nr:putative metal-binding motif-containing protein [Chitinophagaceae bacterium]